MKTWVWSAALLLAGCRMPGEKQDFSKITEDFVYGSLALAPVTATLAGYHEHRGRELDEKLDDYSRGGMQERRTFFRAMETRLTSIPRESLDPEDRVDYRIIEDQIRLFMLETFRIQSFRHNPARYTELIGKALSGPFIREDEPKAKRFQQIIQRLDRVPILLEQARDNLQSAPSVWVRAAREECGRDIALIDETLRAAAPAELKSQYDHAAKLALTALRSFDDLLRRDLSAGTGNWRMGTQFYDPVFQHFLDADKTPAAVLQEARSVLNDLRSEMARVAAPQSVPDALDRLAKQPAGPEEARRDLQDATAFVQVKELVPLPAQADRQVSAPPDSLSSLQVEAWTIREAMPGHAVQSAFAGRVQPRARRLLRTVYGNPAYVQGWGVYALQLMRDQGYREQSKDLQLTFLRELLGVTAAAIVDIQIHTQEMSDEQATELLVIQAYQTKNEAMATLDLAQLTAGQLPAGFVGWRGWLDARRQAQSRKGSAFRVAEFQEQALKRGAVPLPEISR